MSGVDYVAVNTQNKTILLNTTVNDDHDNQGDNKEEKKDYVDCGVSLSRILFQISLNLTSSV